MTITKSQIVTGLLVLSVLGLFAWNIVQSVNIGNLYYNDSYLEEGVSLHSEAIQIITDVLTY